MTATTLQDGSDFSAGRLTREEAWFARRELSRRRLRAFGLVTPLLLFIGFAFFAPIATMLNRSVYNPTVVRLIPDTLKQLQGWDGRGTPDAAILTSMAIDLKRLANDRKSGKLGEQLNRSLPGTSSAVKSTARKLRQIEDAELAASGAALLLEANDKWASPKLWRTVRETGRTYRETYFLTALDLERNAEGRIQRREAA